MGFRAGKERKLAQDSMKGSKARQKAVRQ